MSDRMQMEADQENDISRCFVPEILVDFLEKQIRLGKDSFEPSSYFLHGVCLLVDISGFTKISGDFCAQGKNGIDGLQLATNGYMGKLVETIYLFGGDIIKFAGDAIICIFPSTLITKVVKSARGNALRRSIDKSNSFCDACILLATVEETAEGSEKSMMSTFRRRSSIRPDHVLRAMHCANELRTIRTETLSVHVAISCGDLCFGVLGGYENRWECLISGPCLEELSGCLDDAPSMQAVMTGTCYEIVAGFHAMETHNRNMMIVNEDNANLKEQDGSSILGYKYNLEQLPSGNCKILSVTRAQDTSVSEILPASAPTRSEAALQTMIQQFVPVLINEANKHGTSLNYLSEIREVTTMFMKWDSYDANVKHQDLIKLQDCFFEAQKILHTTGAYLRQFLVDDKGCVLIACWGMPSQTYLDNAHRALTAAADIRAALLRLHMKCSFGITTGDVYCGTVGSALRMEYAAIGNVVNMSARLMGKAHGGILIDEATYLRLPPSAHSLLDKLDPIQVKGRAEPMQVYEHHSKAPPPLIKTPTSSETENDTSKNSHEIRDCCRKPFADLLKALDGRNALMSMRDLFSSISPGSRGRMKVLLLEGKKGAGCKSSQAWLYKQALSMSIHAIHVSLGDKNGHYAYYLLYKIFTQLAPKDLYTSKVSQRRYVHALLKEVYPDDADMAARVAFPIMKKAMAMTCSYASDQSEVSVAMGAGASAKSIKIKHESKFPTRLITDVLCTIFTHLLTERTVLVIIDDIHNSDEESLRVLVELLKIDSRSAIVMNGVPPHDSQGPDFRKTKDKGKKKIQFLSAAKAPAINLSRYRSSMVAEPNVTVIPVGVFTASEIGAMLQAIPGSADFPPHLAALVANISGGEFFWIREIMRFLHESGSKQFLSTIGSSGGEGESERPPMGSLQRGSSIVVLSTATTSSSSSALVTRGNSFSITNKPSVRRAASSLEEFKLEQLVVCRFENLNLATKQVLRTASIIGPTFSRSVLYGVLPRNLKADVASCLLTLVQQQWIERSTDDTEIFEFRHVYSHQIIYNITPESERRNLHKVIADYIEEISAGDASQAALLCYHYGMFDPDKALYYTYQATMFLLENGSFFELGECAELLYQAVDYCVTLSNIDVLVKLTNQVMKETADIQPQARRSTSSHAVRRFFSGGCCTSTAAVYVSEDPTSFSVSVLSLADSAEADASHHHFLAQLQELLALLSEKRQALGQGSARHVPKDWEKSILSASVKIRHKPPNKKH